MYTVSLSFVDLQCVMAGLLFRWFVHSVSITFSSLSTHHDVVTLTCFFFDTTKKELTSWIQFKYLFCNYCRLEWNKPFWFSLYSVFVHVLYNNKLRPAVYSTHVYVNVTCRHSLVSWTMYFCCSITMNEAIWTVNILLMMIWWMKVIFICIIKHNIKFLIMK